LLFPDAAIVQGTVDTTPRLTSAVPSIGANPMGFLALSGILALVMNVGPALVRSIPVRLLLACVYMVELFMTRTRSALLIGVVVLLLTVIVNIKRRPVLATYVIISGLAAALLGITVYAKEIASYFVRGQSAAAFQTLTGRTEVWNVAWRAIEENPLTGLGFYAGHRLGIPVLNSYQDRGNLDNTWIEALVDVGIIGTIPLAVMLVGAWLRAVQAHDEPVQSRIWALSLLSYALSVSLINPTVQSGLGMNWILTLVPAAAFISSNHHSAALRPDRGSANRLDLAPERYRETNDPLEV
jgi:O-antigen ligase